MKKIPKEFECMGSTIKVVYDNEYCNENGLLGEAYPTLNKIVLSDRESDGSKIPLDKQIQVFLHEAVHIWMDALGYRDLYADEKFTDQLSGLIHQMLKTKIFK